MSGSSRLLGIVGHRSREEHEGAIHHVYARGNNRQIVFRDDGDRRTYLAMLACVVCDRGWRCLCYCLMTNHVHLVIETPQPNLHLGMRDLQRDYTLAFNERHDHVGHVFHKPFRSRRIKDDAHLATVVTYVVANPVSAGLVDRPEEYPWGSHATLAAGMPPPCLDFPRLLEHFAVDSQDPLRRYHELIDDRLQ